ncbi:MAG: metallopeptidase family protein [Bdellovibrionales bacterium]|nr:metallopeptidase family protein [Bdellovibrionales bacterium]
MTDAQFDQIVSDVWQRLEKIIPPDLLPHLANILFVIENEPTPDILREIADTELADDPLSICGLHVGVPLTETTVSAPPLIPTHVYLFRMALLDMVDYDGSEESIAELKEEIAITLLHEIGHYFGLSEEDLDRLGFA